MYYFCNFLGREFKGYGVDGLRFSVSEGLDAEVGEAVCYRRADGVLCFAGAGEVVDGEVVDFIGEAGLDSALVSSEENPIILIATRKLGVYSDIPSYIKYIPVEGGMLVALISGYVSVESKDGELLPLSRCYDGDLDGKVAFYDASSIRDLNILKDMDSDILYSNYVVSDCVISHSVGKDGNRLKSVRFGKKNFVVLNSEIFVRGKAKKDAELKAKKEAKKRRDEEIARFNAEYKLRMEEEKKAKGTGEVKKGRKKSASSKVEVNVGSDGASEFLRILSSMQ